MDIHRGLVDRSIPDDRHSGALIQYLSLSLLPRKAVINIFPARSIRLPPADGLRRCRRTIAAERKTTKLAHQTHSGRPATTFGGSFAGATLFTPRHTPAAAG
jgi:hypothetical protein